MSKSVECPTLDFGLGHDPRVVGSSPESGSALIVETTYDSLSSSAAPPTHALSLSLSLILSQNLNK